MTANIRSFEQGLRATAGFAAVLNVVVNPFAPAWLALIGAYLVLTSILTWDPVYAVARKAAHTRPATRETMGEGSLHAAR